MVQISVTSEGGIAGFVPEMQVMSVPYLFSSRSIAMKVLNGWFGDELEKAIKKRTGLRVLFWAENGFRHFTNNVHPIKNAGDVKGLKIRVMESPAYISMIKAMGGNPTPIAWNELYTALQQKVVDGQENPITNIISAKLYEHQKYLTLDGHVYSPHIWLINEDFYQSLPDDVKLLLQDLSIQGQWVHLSKALMKNVLGLQFLKEQGVEVYTPTPKELPVMLSSGLHF